MAETKSGKGEGRPQNELPPGPQIYVLSVFFSWVVPNGLKWCCMSRAFHFDALDTPHAYILTKLKSAPLWGHKIEHFGPKRALLGAPGVPQRSLKGPKHMVWMRPTQLDQPVAFGIKSGPRGCPRTSGAPNRGFGVPGGP